MTLKETSIAMLGEGLWKEAWKRGGTGLGLGGGKRKEVREQGRPG
jgi:hypothetical protein